LIAQSVQNAFQALPASISPSSDLESITRTLESLTANIDNILESAETV
jgi:hypothetical protein